MPSNLLKDTALRQSYPFDIYRDGLYKKRRGYNYPPDASMILSNRDVSVSNILRRKDITANSNHGIYKSGRVAHANGSTGLITFNQSAGENPEHLSATCVFQNDSAGLSGDQHLLGKWDSNGDERSWRLYIDSDEKVVLEVSGDGTTSNYVSITTDAAITINTLSRVGFSFADGIGLIYVNGNLVASTSSVTGTGANAPYEGTAPITACGILSSGSIVGASAWDGYIGDIRIYDTDISSAAHLAIMYFPDEADSGEVQSDEIIRATIDNYENGDTPVLYIDYSGNHHHGIVSGTIAVVTGLEYPIPQVVKKGHSSRNTGNLLNYPQDYSNAAWSKLSGASITSTTELDPLGGNTACTIDVSAGGSARVAQDTVTVPANDADVTFSIWLRADTPGNWSMQTRIKNAADIQSWVVAVTTEWQLFTRTWNAGSTGVNSALFWIAQHGLGTITEVDAWGANVNIASSANTYVPGLVAKYTDSTMIISAYPDEDSDVTNTAVDHPNKSNRFNGTGDANEVLTVSDDSSLDDNNTVVLSMAYIDGDGGTYFSKPTVGANKTISRSGAIIDVVIPHDSTDGEYEIPLVQGSQLLADPLFDLGTEYTLTGSGMTITGGKLVVDNDSTYESCITNFSQEIGKRYIAIVQTSNPVIGGVRLAIGSQIINAGGITTAGVHLISWVGENTNILTMDRHASGNNNEIDVDSFKVYEVPDNVAYMIEIVYNDATEAPNAYVNGVLVPVKTATAGVGSLESDANTDISLMDGCTDALDICLVYDRALSLSESVALHRVFGS